MNIRWRVNLRRTVVPLAGLLLLGGGLALYLWLFAGLPTPDDLSAYTLAPSSKVYDRHGRLLFEIPPPYTGSHTPVPLQEIPEALRWATIATEDKNFYTHPGFDLVGILRAVWINLTCDDCRVGGSTITQQVVRTLMFAPDERFAPTLRRKLREVILAVRITRRYTKDEILAAYLNETYYGNMAYGVEAAAQAYYGKPVRDLDLAECAMLAGLPQAPAYWNPLEHGERARSRQAIVLDLMVKAGYIDAAQARLAKAEKLSFAAAPFPIRAPHAVMYVRGFLERELGLARLQTGGLEIHTTLDVDLNETARDMMRHRLRLLALCNHQPECPPGGHNVRNAALVALDPWTGEVLAMVGSPDYFATHIDGAVNGATALRQPGSSIKPLTYAVAFAPDAAFEGAPLTAATMMLDVRTSFVTREGTPYVPLNYDLTFRGPVRLREALAASYNLIAVKVLETVGVERMTGLARRMGITTFDDPDRLGLALTLGGGEVRLLELTAAYGAFANGGWRVHPTLVRYVETAEGQRLWSAGPALGERVLDPRVAHLITDVLSDDTARVSTFGEGSVLALPRPAAVKTGTTTNFRDNWTVGYTPSLVVGVWVGNADNEPMRDVTGVTGAAPLWRDVTLAAMAGRPALDFPRPDGLIEAEVCALSGQRPNPDCPHRVMELFIAGTVPTATCAMHQRIGDTVYTVLPPEAHAWAREHHVAQPPAAAPDPEQPAPALYLISPDAGSAYRIDPAAPRDAQRIAVVAEASRSFAAVTLEVNGTPLQRFAAPPYRALWQLTPGVHTFTAVGHTADGETVTSNAITVEVAGD
jgi:penicillin-binding protein 1C